jgi:tartrate dehydratase alpha subunit/fumarate hydratase class I-like protein
VYRINTTLPSGILPSVQIFVHEYGINEPDKVASQIIEATKDKSKDEIAKEIGLEIIKNSKVLEAWFKENKK